MNVFTVYPDEVTKEVADASRRKKKKNRRWWVGGWERRGRKGEKRNVTIFVDAFSRAGEIGRLKGILVTVHFSSFSRPSSRRRPSVCSFVRSLVSTGPVSTGSLAKRANRRALSRAMKSSRRISIRSREIRVHLSGAVRPRRGTNC